MERKEAEEMRFIQESALKQPKKSELSRKVKEHKEKDKAARRQKQREIMHKEEDEEAKRQMVLYDAAESVLTALMKKCSGK